MYIKCGIVDIIYKCFSFQLSRIIRTSVLFYFYLRCFFSTYDYVYYFGVCFVDRCLAFCTFSFGHCVVCSSSIYRFWLPLWYIFKLFLEHWYFSKWFHLHSKLKHVMLAILENVLSLLSVYWKNICRFRKGVGAL